MATLIETPVIRLADSGPERRMFPRQQAYGHIHGQRLDRNIPAVRRNPHLALNLRDISVGGMSAWTQVELQVGERLLLFFPPEGFHKGFDIRGRVVRCEQSALGFRVGIAFEATLETALRKAA